ncbi:Sodium-and chloride-dependent creatine transporter 1 [Aphelenchoides bicaudatus]|nr:Sodium-and chloride-dependent creatine transporter 1 [Aphelenchoides bicaudatus]
MVFTPIHVNFTAAQRGVVWSRRAKLSSILILIVQFGGSHTMTGGKLHRALSGDDSADPKIRTGLDQESLVANDHDVPPNSPAGRKVSVLGVEVVDRGQWTGPLDFLMSMIAYAVGLGNVWRFPYLCYKNGGGSFLFAYFIFFFMAAIPIFLMEVTVGQYLQRGAMEMWKMCPLFKGVGIGNVVIAFMCISYFCVIVAWAIFYMISSFNSTFPWETCNNWWNVQGVCITGKETPEQVRRIAANLSRYGLTTETSVEQFWERRVLKSTDNLEEFGGIQWELLALMALAWVVVYFALWKGITQARKFVYFCAIFPYGLIVVLLLRGLTLPGAMTGISFYLTPNITKLSEATVWKDAGTQVFYSYGVGFGTLIALGSHNKFTHNCYRDSIIMCFINGSTSILAGFAIFSILGYMSAYPEVATNLPLKQLWAFLFFLMITILGLDSQVCMMEGLFTALEDTFPTLLRKYKKISLLITCIFFFIIGIPMVTYSGSHWLTLVDNYGASGYALLFVVFFEVVGLAWGFGADKVRNALKEMLGFFPNPVFPILWKYASPLVTLVMFFFCLIMYEPIKYPNGRDFPTWAMVFGFVLSSTSMVVIPAYAIYYLFLKRSNLSLKERWERGIHPPKDYKYNTGHLKATNEEELQFIDGTKTKNNNH